MPEGKPELFDEDKPAKNLETMDSDAPRQAREQAATYRSVFAGPILRFDDGTTMELPPHPDLRMFDEDVLEDYDQYMFDVRNTFDREPDVWFPEQKVTDSQGKELTLPATLRKGRTIVPFQKTDADGKVELVKPPHEIKLVQMVLGEAEYKRLRSKTVNGKKAGAKDVWRAWNERGEDLMERRDADPKSDGGAVDGAPVPEADTP